jgi:competence ComEA-like helix-hairpin-helix protein
MFDLEKRERILIIFLIFMLLLGSGIAAYNKSHRRTDLKIGHFDLEIEKKTMLVNINEAEIEDLMRLKGIGKVLAQRIIDYRNSNGPFRDKERLKNVKGIGDALFENIKNDITVE